MKDAYYFSHDSNARNDQRLMKVRMKYGPEGYGIYFMIIEILRDTENYTLNINDIHSICFDTRTKNETVLDILKNYNLFVFEDDFFYSKSLKRRMERLDEIKQKRSYAGQMSGKARQVINKQEADVEQVLNSKVKHSKEKDSKENKISIKTGKFKKQVLEFQSKYDLEMLEEFILYWTEPNKSNTKIKWEMEVTWHMGRRLARWANSNYQAKSPAQQFKQNGNLNEASGRGYNNLAEQSKKFRNYMADAKNTAADPQEIGQILGQTLKKLKPTTEVEEEKDGQ